MRLLHTSDWHLGRSFHGQAMLGHQAAFFDHLLEVIESEQVDVVMVAGDVYDRALPPVDAVALADEVLARLAASRARVVITSGNHDSARRLGFSSRLIDAAGVHLRTDPSALATPIVIDDEHGPVAFYGIPFLDPQALAGPWGLAKASHQHALAEAMTRIRADLAGRSGHRSVVLAHAFVAGGTPSDSERDITVGGVQRVATEVFDDITYTALGHLHGPHVLTDALRYSGSPLAYSFSEAGQVKGTWLVDLDGDGVARGEFVPAPVPRGLVRLRGALADLLLDPDHEHAEGAWVEATLTDAVHPLQPMDRLRERFPHAVALRFEATRAPAGISPVVDNSRSDHALALDFVAELRGEPASESEAALLALAVEACCTGAEAVDA